jgi:hypothetical protein
VFDLGVKNNKVMGSDHRLAFSVNLVAGIDPVTKNINWLAEMRNIASISLPTYCAFYHAFPCELIHLSEHGLFMVAERTSKRGVHFRDDLFGWRFTGLPFPLKGRKGSAQGR